MKVFKGIAYNFKGLKLGLRTPGLLALGLVRFAVVLFLTIIAIGLVWTKYQQIANLVWTQPESTWILWLWYLVSWLLALLLSGISAVIAFLVAQLLFSVLIMDHMSRMTERKVTGGEAIATGMPFFTHYYYLLKQELPRAILPVCISLALMIIGWLTPLSPITTIVSPLVAGLFLAWDNTDLVPARRMEPFGQRLAFLRRNLGFHLGFGLCFLIPILNILLLSFAPIGATMFYVEQIDQLKSK